MKYRYLGNSGLAVSRVCLGTATFGQEGWGCNTDTAIKILNVFKNQGGNFIDTADSYGTTLSERIVGQWLSGQNRENFVIATKCFFPTSDNINGRGLSRKHLISACDASLKRLKTDYIDLYQVHESDPQTPIEETMSALDSLVKQGKVRYIGCSNYPAWKVMKSSFISRSGGWAHFVSGQYLYNLLKRDIEAEVLPACKDSGMGIICWSPLSGGMLTGKYKDINLPPEGTRLAARSNLTENYYNLWYDKSIKVVQKLIDIAKQHDVTPSTVALSWLLKNEQVASVSVGASRPEQIEDNCRAGDWIIPNGDTMVLNDLSNIAYGNPYDICQKIGKDWFAQIL